MKRFVVAISLFALILSIFGQKSLSADQQKDNENLPPCAACKVLVESFKKGIEKTKREKFDGGDAAWEEDKLGSYKTSEVRLIEIQENLCKDLKKSQNQCYSLAEELEATIEEWWFENQEEYPDLYKFLCIEKAERCCEKDHFGPNCEKCPGYPDQICNNNGKCKGSGTRKGNGKCACDKGYSGSMCFECASGFYQSYADDKKLLCSECHKACKGNCLGGGAKKCLECNKGWIMTEENGCIDINECLDQHTCKGNTFCVNNDGNYTCLACDKACQGCSGDGPDMCTGCAEGFRKEGSFCVNTDILGRKKQENLTRYATYFGLAVATCIILQKNFYAAAAIGLLVGVYISVSEYMIASSSIQDTLPKMNFLGEIS